MVQHSDVNKKTICLIMVILTASITSVMAFGSSPSWHSIRYASSTISSPSSKRILIRRRATAANSLLMFDGGLHTSNRVVVNNVRGDKTSNGSIQGDKANIGNLMVPFVGVGTISWSSKSCKCILR